MSDVESSPYQNESFPRILDQKEKVETIGGHQRNTALLRDKVIVSPRRPKKRVTLARQDTFNLENEDLVPRQNLNGRAKSSYGIKAILERADTMSSLAPEVREYLEAHMRMMGEENSRMMAENAQLRAEVMVTSSECEKKVKTVSLQLERERAKTRMLLSKVRAGEAGGSEDVILVAGGTSSSSGRRRSATLGSGPGRRAGKEERRPRPASVTSVSSMWPGTPLPEGAGDEARLQLLTKKIKVYRSVVDIESIIKDQNCRSFWLIADLKSKTFRLRVRRCGVSWPGRLGRPRSSRH